MIDQKAFRNALGSFATGVCVVIAKNDEGRYVGMTINSFSSVSLEPSLVLWGLKRESHSYSLFANADKFVFNVLSLEQQDVAGRYARFGDHLIDHDDLTFEQGTPVIKGAISFFECNPWDRVVAGDHDVLIGKVIKFDSQKERNPLTFFNGKYCGLETLEALEA